MPIKFRCQFCQQLLGISRSQAGAIVDCPRCGRSLRVPDLNGRTRKLPDPKSSVKHDPNLLNALSELSEIGETNDSTIASAHHDEQQSHAISLEPLAQSSPKHVEISYSAPTVEPELNPEKPVAIRESLQELAAFSVEQPNSKNVENLTVRSTEQGKSNSLFLPVALSVTFLIVGFFAGKRLTGVSAQATDVPDSIQAEPGHQAENSQGQQQGEDVSATIRGRVLYQDATGNQLPDVDAMILALPTVRRGTIKWNSRSLTRDKDHPDRIAVLAALATCGAGFARADSSGQFRIDLPERKNLTIIVASRHVERPADVPVPPQILSILDSYFDSTSHVCGRLSVQSVTNTEQPIIFAANK